jgi:hypothetical protein
MNITNLECNCKLHQIEIEKMTFGKAITMLAICIYEHRSQKTGKLLKKRKLIGDVVLEEKDINLLKDFLNE